MKNNKGMVLSIYIYILLIFFLLILSTMLMVLNNTKLLATKMKDNMDNELKTTISDFSIVLRGNTDFYVVKGFNFVDPGYVAQTNGGESITATITSNVNTSVLGNYTCTYEITYNGVQKSITRNVIVVTASYAFNYTGAVQTFTVPVTGYYKLEVWGAQGGSTDATYIGGYGGYSTGVTYLYKNEVVYIYVGQAGSGGTASSYATTFNGGGASGGGGTNPASRAGGSGGGATHIAKSTGLLSTLSSKMDTILIVAGGGGGASYMASTAYGSGSSAGGYVGTTATFTKPSSTYYNVPSTGGSQSAGGTNGYGYSVVSGSGSFGLSSTLVVGDGGGGGGGGGFYGGGSGQYIPGAGGSGYIANPSLLSYGSVTKSMYCYNCSTSSTSSILTYSTTNVSSTATSNYAKSGNGYAKMIYVGSSEPTRTNTNLDNVRYIKDCTNGNSINTSNHWVEIKAIYKGINVALNKTITGSVPQNATYPYSRIVDGDTTANNWSTGSPSTGLQCVTVDLTKEYDLSSINVWHYYTDSRIYNNNTTYVSSDNTNWVSVIANSNAETITGKSVIPY